MSIKLCCIRFGFALNWSADLVSDLAWNDVA
jgi:hypothetical protein